MKTQNKQNKTSITIKGLVIIFMCLLLIIPTLFISALVNERSSRKGEAESEVANKWGGVQAITGPILIIPYIERGTSAKRYCYVLPEDLNIEAELENQIRKRGIFEMNVYQAKVDLKGYFTYPDWSTIGLSEEDLLLNEAYLCLEISDFVGIEELPTVVWDSIEQQVSNDIPIHGFLQKGLSSKVEFFDKEKHYFEASIALRGSSDLYFSPVGKSTTASVKSDWQHPSFVGSYLPTNNPNVTNEGFSAEWKVLALNRSYPQLIKSITTHTINKESFGVSFIQPSGYYTKVDRSVKYAFLLIALTFALYFFIELLQKKNIHPLQYVLVGFALCIFYTLLLALSELIGFSLSYLIAAAATVGLIGWYSKGILKSTRIALLLILVLSSLYGAIYILIQLEDKALLFGSIGLFMLLATVMYFSRKIDWYSQEEKGQPIQAMQENQQQIGMSAKHHPTMVRKEDFSEPRI